MTLLMPPFSRLLAWHFGRKLDWESCCLIPHMTPNIISLAAALCSACPQVTEAMEKAGSLEQRRSLKATGYYSQTPSAQTVLAMLSSGTFSLTLLYQTQPHCLPLRLSTAHGAQ